MTIGNIFDLSGKTVIITGGAGHLGSAMSEAVAAYGADLFILGHNAEKAIEKATELKTQYNLSICEGLMFDIADGKSVNDAISAVINRTNKIDVLINNAVYGCSKSLEDYTYEEWTQGIDGTINGVFRVTQACLRQMIKQGSGNIINIASMYGVVAPDMSIYGDSGQNNPANYGAGKAAIIQFTKYLSTVYGSKGIRANSISPGPFPNPDVQKNSQFINELCRKTPLHRIGKPEDLYGIIVFLASDSSNYLTGQNISIDGGWTSW